MTIVLGILALGFGLFFAGCEIIGTYEFLLKDQQGLTYVVFAGSGIAAAVSLLPAWATLAWRGRKGLSVCLWVLFVLSLVTVISAALSRTGSMTDTAQGDREHAGIARKASIEARDAAQADVTKAEAALADARRNVVAQAALKTCAANCARLLADAVTDADDDLAAARQRLTVALAGVVAAPPETTDSMSRRIAALVPWVTEEQVRLYQPIFVPVLTSSTSAILTALGIWALFGVRRATEPKVGKSDAASAAQTSSLAAASVKPLAATSIAPLGAPAVPPLKAVPPLAAEAVQPLAVAPPTPAPALLEVMAPERLQLAGPRSPVAPFASSQIVRDRKSELHLREARRAYEKFCRTNIEDPLELPVFVRELASLCERTGIQVRVKGKDVFLVGARLANHASG